MLCTFLLLVTVWSSSFRQAFLVIDQSSTLHLSMVVRSMVVVRNHQQKFLSSVSGSILCFTFASNNVESQWFTSSLTGVGLAGIAAVETARTLGATVWAYDVRPMVNLIANTMLQQYHHVYAHC